jgi:hypothetical protein
MRTRIPSYVCHSIHAASFDTHGFDRRVILTSFFSIGYIWPPACLFVSREVLEPIMETMLQGLVIIGGLTFSLATSLLIEELIFGQIVRLAFARRAKSSVPDGEKN